MNLALIDPFVLAQDCPEVFVGGLRSGHSAYLRFNRRGDYLASGRHDGTVSIFDVETNGVARKLRGHLKQVQSLSWSQCGRYLLTASLDWKCILWDLNDGSRIRTVRLEAAVFMAELHPQNHMMFTAALFEDKPVLVNMSPEIPVKDILSSAPKRSSLDQETLSERQLAQDAKQQTTAICWSHSGQHVLAGTSRGWLNIIESSTRDTLYSTRLATGIIMGLRLDPTGRILLTNSSDRIIRTVQLPDLDSANLDFGNLRLEPEYKFQDIVNRLSWHHIALSPSADYVTASILMNHHIYVWERGHGSLEKILEGPREELGSVEWHPHKPMLAANGIESGRIYFWSINTPQRWSALAPDFQEVEENVEYIEREDEFDIQPAEEIHKRILNQEDEDIDVLTVEPEKYMPTSKDFQMPVLLDLDDSDSDDDLQAIGAGQFRRKTPSRGTEVMLEEDAAPA